MLRYVTLTPSFIPSFSAGPWYAQERTTPEFSSAVILVFSGGRDLRTGCQLPNKNECQILY